MDRPKRFESLDGLRGVCALMVAIRHCIFVTHNGHLLSHAYLCVDAFFVVSGFVIAHVYEQRLTESLTFRDFLLARARRLLPTHLLGTLCVAIAALACMSSTISPLHGLAAGQIIRVVALAMILIPDISATFLYPVNGPLWSLLDEWVANALYAVQVRRVQLPVLICAAMCLWALLVAWCLQGHRNDFDVGSRSHDLVIGIGRALAGFLAGVAVFRLQTSKRLAVLPNVTPGLPYAICFLYAALPISLRSPLLDLAVIATFPLIAALLVRSEKRPARIFLWLGRLSYPLYVSQFAAITVAGAILGDRGVRSVAYAIPIIAFALAIAWGIERLVALTMWRPSPSASADPTLA